MFNFTVSVQERPDGSVYTQSIDLHAKRDDSTPNERRVADTIKQAVQMARVAQTKPAKQPGDDVSYLDTARIFSELEWALGMARRCTGGPGMADE
jgi:hypothetical protein